MFRTYVSRKKPIECPRHNWAETSTTNGVKLHFSDGSETLWIESKKSAFDALDYWISLQNILTDEAKKIKKIIERHWPS